MADVEEIRQLIRFRGPPADLTAALVEPVEGVTDLPVTVEFEKKGAEELEAIAVTEAEGHVLRLALPERTAPGSYTGAVALNGEEQAVRLEVEPAPDVRVVPESLRIAAEPGSRTSVDVSILNLGNVPVSVRGTQAVGLFLEGGVERALHRAYVDKMKEDARRVDVFAEALSDSHGGLVRMSLEGGGVDIAPGGCRRVTMAVKIPSGIEVGRVYTGSWTLEDATLPVRIVVPGEEVEATPEEDDDQGEE